MSEHVQKTKTTHAQEDVIATDVKDVKDAKLSSETDDILDEIDNVLEENSEAFVKNYVQKGGQ